MCLSKASSCLAQLVERKTLNLVVVGSIPTEGALFFLSVTRRNFRQDDVSVSTYASMAEWSKAVDLSSILLCRRGFEPHSRHCFFLLPVGTKKMKKAKKSHRTESNHRPRDYYR